MDTENSQAGNGAKLFVAGIIFSILWPSASTATKIALEHAQPFVISIVRFIIAGVIMLLIVHGGMRKRLPAGVEWKQLCIYGLLNITLYLSLYIVAMQNVSAGLGSLAIATNPVFISLISAAILRKPLKQKVVLSLALCITGVLIAAWPLFKTAHATPLGLSLLILSMVLYSAGVIYFSERNWNGLHILAINGWQTLIGGLFVFPLVLVTYDGSKNHFTQEFFASTFWLAIPVSIVAVQLWLYMLRDNPVRASFWLFLCPLAGFVIANAMVNEPITFYTITGMVLVITGLYLVQKKRQVN